MKKRKITISKLRAKLRNTEEKLLDRTKEILNIRKKLRRLEKREKKQGLVNMEGREAKKKARKRDRILLHNSQRRLMRSVVSRFYCN